MAQQNEGNGWWQKARDKVATIYDRGGTDLYLSGYVYHGHSTYSEKKLSEFNDNLWGGGVGKSLRNAKGDLETLYAMAIADSHNKPQFMAGYAYQWIWHPGGPDIEAGAGLAALLISRQDYFGGFPFPIVLPVGSIGSRRAKLMLSYVPHLPGNNGGGNVLYVFANFELK